jgi:hypothetical protein
VRELAGAERVEVAASAHDLWALRWDFRRLPEYNPHVGAVRRTRVVGPGEAGGRYEFALATPDGERRVTLEVTESVTDRLVATAMLGALAADERFEVTPLGWHSSAAELKLWLALPPGLDERRRSQLLEGGRLQIRQELDAMRALLEGGAPGGRARGVR